MSREVAESTNVTLVELLDRVIDRGVILAGDITISVADVDLIYLGLRVMLASVERMERMEGLRAEREESRDS
jgi:hypothetical protein